MNNVRPENIIIIDIETASEYPDFEMLNDEWKALWEEKVNRILPDGFTAAEFYQHRAGVMAEFSRIICISIAYFRREEESLKMRVKSFYEADEKKLLEDFISTMHKIEGYNKNWCFAGHNIKEFDIPFICRRMLMKGISLPPFLNFQNMKPWETNIIDTFQYWRFGDYKNFTSLKLLAAAMGVPSPKDDIDGSMVGELYWKATPAERESGLKRIVAYCQKDVITTGNIILRFKNMPVIAGENIQYAE